MKRPNVKRPKPIKSIKKYARRRPSIQEVIREATAGGVVYRYKNKKIEILLIQDAKNRWTIPKGHIEEGEKANETAAREVTEETGLKHLDVQNWLGKINFRYRRENSLILMSQQIYLIHATKDTDALVKEDWMKGIQWFEATEALDKIEYEDIGKLILLALKKLREKN